MKNFKKGYLSCGTENYGKIGKPTNMRDDDGTKLFVGDVVELFDDGDASCGKRAVAESKGEQFVMGIAGDCDADGRISGGWRIKKKRSYTEVADGESVDNITYHTKGKPKFCVGQIYRVGTCGDEEGNIIKITLAGDRYERYEVIRGSNAYSKYFGINSIFANSLILLTGKEIGKAIRKWDIKRSKTGVREVKREAKVGEYIRITGSHRLPSTYHVGEIHKVTSDTATSGNGAGVDVDDGRSVILHDNYIVLEGYKPQNTDASSAQAKGKRKPKPGDRVRILYDNGGAVTAGSEWTVSLVGDDGIVYFDGLGYCCYPGNCIVISSGRQGKHIYTEAEITEAKKLCGKMMAEAFDDGNTFNLRFLDKNRSESDNIVHCDVARLNGKANATGFAKCSDHDEYNVWIGRCVALCKALHKPIPSFIMGDGKGKHFDFEKAKAKGTSKDGTMVVIHFQNDAERDELLKAIESMGINWTMGQKPTEWKKFDSQFVVVKDHVLYSDQPDGESNYVEFSDCFTEG